MKYKKLVQLAGLTNIRLLDVLEGNKFYPPF
jgi:hypothetical protein